MDLKIFYQKMREVEAAIAEDPTLVVSLETSDGGKPGLVSEVRRAVAARLLVEGRARLTDENEAAEYRTRTKAARLRLEQEAKTQQVQFSFISEKSRRKG